MEMYKLRREINIEDGYDVVIAGGGPAGTAAAICASRLGAKVLLIEATGCLGGMGTSGLVAAFNPIADGERLLIGGFMKELVDELYEKGYMQPGLDANQWHSYYKKWIFFHPEGLKITLDRFVREAGVEVRFFTKVIDAETDKKSRVVKGVILHNIEGYSYIQAKTFIDCTGDAFLADLCGVKCREAGRDTPKIMPPTLCSLFANIDWEKFDSHAQCDPDLIKKAYDSGAFSQLEYSLSGMHRVGNTLGNLNAGHIFKLNALRCKDLTQGTFLGRKLAQEYLEFYKKNVSGCEQMEIVTTSNLMGVRESRRIVGEYEVNLDDYKERRQFHDQVGVINLYIDIHPYDCTEEELAHSKNQGKNYALGVGECVGMPYGITVPKGWKNLWVAGRSVSCDISMQAVIRGQTAAYMLGEAAGSAAVQAIHMNQSADAIDTEVLISTLRKKGGYLHQKELNKEMTRS